MIPKNFKVKKSHYLEEIQAELIEVEHIPTGACIVHLKNSDIENAFCLGFQTLPLNSTGVAHILEHIVLCGSKKYPVKDPFFSMMRRSLNTFMNAFTGSDFTLYPASSQVPKDFYNLLDVYLDATFFPELKKISFSQEGHRLDFDPQGNLMFKGVVFNEMKGAMSSPDQRLWVDLFKHLTPDLPYANNSGGDPLHIVNLSYEELKEFHKTHYHPSNAIFYFYGNLPLEKHLEAIEEKVLAHFEKAPKVEQLPLQKRFSSPKFVTGTFPSHDDSGTIHTIGCLCAKATDYEKVLALSVLDSYLMDTDASCLKQKLLKSGLCKEVNSYLDTEMSEVSWILVFKGVEEKNRQAIHDLVFSSLKEIAQSPFAEDELESSMHQLEFSRSEITGDRLPYGLGLYMRAFIAMPHGVNPEENLMIHKPFEKLKEKCRDKNYLPSLLKEAVIENTHVVDLLMLPDQNLQKQEEAEEKKILESISSHLTEEKKEQIKTDATKLKEYQEAVETQNVECLPTVTLDDIEKKTKNYPLIKKEKELYSTFFYEDHTNDILYLDLSFKLPKVEKEDLFYLSLFTSFLTELGTKSSSYEERLKQIQAYTGGLYCSLLLDVDCEKPKEVIPSISIRTKGFYRHTEKLFYLLKETCSSIDFTNKDRLKTLLFQTYTLLEHSLASQSMRYAKTLSQSPFSQVGTLTEHLYGLTFFNKLKELVKDLDNKIDFLIEKLENLKPILTQNNFELLVTCDKSHYEKLEEKNFYQIETLAKNKLVSWDNSIELNSITSTFYTAPTPVSFSSYSLDSIGYTNVDSPALLVASELLENIYLHEEIREKGGAYGSGASYHSQTATFSFHGYRDPHISETLSHFKKAVRKAIEGNFSEQDVFEAKLGIFQSIDAPESPQGKGRTAYHWNKVSKTLEKRQHYRDAIFNVSKKDIQTALEKHLLPHIEKGVFVCFAGKDLLEKENKKLENALQILDPTNTVSN